MVRAQKSERPLPFENAGWLFRDVPYDPLDWSRKTDLLVAMSLSPKVTHDEAMTAARLTAPVARPLSMAVQRGLVERISAARDDSRVDETRDAFLAFLRSVWKPSVLRAATQTTFKPGSFETSCYTPNGVRILIGGELPYRKRSQDLWQYMELAPEQSEKRLGHAWRVSSWYRKCIESALGPFEGLAAAYQFAAPRRQNGSLRPVYTRIALLDRGEKALKGGWVSDVDYVNDGNVGRFVLVPSDYLVSLGPVLAGVQKISTGSGGYRRR